MPITSPYRRCVRQAKQADIIGMEAKKSTERLCPNAGRDRKLQRAAPQLNWLLLNSSSLKPLPARLLRSFHGLFMHW